MAASCMAACRPGDGAAGPVVDGVAAAAAPAPDALADRVAALIAEAERPAPFSVRDGRCLRLPPANEALSRARLRAQLGAALAARPHLGAEAWAAVTSLGLSEAVLGKPSSGKRGALACLRGWAYLQAGNHRQALQDGQAAVVYGGQQAAGAWHAAARALCALAHAGLHDPRLAALNMRQASDADPRWAADAAALAQQLAPGQRLALDRAGAEGLRRQLADEREAQLPEVMRSRPKWYYYRAWMSQRIAEQLPALPSPVLDKLLQLDAGDLDLMVTHPVALHGQAAELAAVLEAGGEAALAAHKPALLSWEEVQALAGAGTVGLPLGYTPALGYTPPAAGAAGGGAAGRRGHGRGGPRGVRGGPAAGALVAQAGGEAEGRPPVTTRRALVLAAAAAAGAAPRAAAGG